MDNPQAEAFNLARTALIFVLISFFMETPFEGVKTYEYCKNIFLASHEI